MPDAKTLISDIPVSKRGIGVGIDLGTTNSAVSIINSDGIPRLINMDGKNTMPSLVTIRKNAKDQVNILVGSECESSNKVKLMTNNGYTYRHVKRVIGMGTTTAAASLDLVPHLVIQSASQRRKGKSLNHASKTIGMTGIGLERTLQDAKENPARLLLPPGVKAEMFMDVVDDGDNGTSHTHAAHILTKEDDGGMISPQFISSQILRKLFLAAEKETGQKVTRAVIGVPAYFNDMQREATIEAAMLASSIPKERIRLLREPEAAALAYGIGKQQIGKGDEEELVLVFDLGGGTFDVSILEVGGGIFEVVATGGNNMLGGSDFDARIAQYFSKKMVGHGCQKNYWKEAGDVAERLITSAEQVRIALSNAKDVVLGLPLTENGWLNLQDAKDVIMSNMPRYNHEYEHVTEDGTVDGETVYVRFTRRYMEEICLEEFLALLRPVREVAILARAMLPGDASPSAIESVLKMEEEMEMNFAQNDDRFSDFYDEKGEASTQDHDNISKDILLQLNEYSLKEQKNRQQRGRKRARSVQKDEKKFREQKRKANNEAKMNEPNVKVRDGITGRRLTQVVLVGGATRMPAIGRLLASLTGVVPQKTVNPDDCVSLGCAVQVGILDGLNTELQVLTPIEAAMMRALAKKRGLDTDQYDFDDFDDMEEGDLS